MSKEFPDWVNAKAAAEGRKIYRGSIPLARFKRLTPSLESSEGEAIFEADFSFDMDRRAVINLSVSADLALQCQASLETYLQPVKRASVLGVVAEEAEQDSLPEHYDPVQSDHGRLALQDLVEEELLLGMPQVPRKPGLEPVTYRTVGSPIEDEETGKRRNPFAQLGDMLAKQEDQQ